MLCVGCNARQRSPCSQRPTMPATLALLPMPPLPYNASTMIVGPPLMGACSAPQRPALPDIAPQRSSWTASSSFVGAPLMGAFSAPRCSRTAPQCPAMITMNIMNICNGRSAPRWHTAPHVTLRSLTAIYTINPTFLPNFWLKSVHNSP